MCNMLTQKTIIEFGEGCKGWLVVGKKIFTQTLGCCGREQLNL